MYYTLGLLLTVSHLVIFDWQISVCLGHGVEGPCPLKTEDRESLNLQVVNPVPHYIQLHAPLSSIPAARAQCTSSGGSQRLVWTRLIGVSVESLHSCGVMWSRDVVTPS